MPLRTPMPFVLVLTLLAGVALTGCGQIKDAIDKKSRISSAKKRVELVFYGVLKDKSQLGKERLLSAYSWSKGGSMLAPPMPREIDDFDSWLKKKGLYPLIDSYEILGVELEEEGFEEAIVTVKINGKKELAIKVPDNGPMMWTKLKSP